MRARPQPNRRRGLLRAALAVIVLLALLIVAIGIAGAITAPPAVAPTPPPTPAGTTTTPTTGVTPTTKSTPAVKAPPTAAPKATPKPTAKKSGTAPLPFLEDGGAAMFARVHALPSNAITSPDGRSVAYLRGTGSAYARSPLIVLDRTSGATRIVAYGDRFSKPAWSPDGRQLLFVRVRPTHAPPGALWTVYRVPVAAGSPVVVARTPALDVRPLGWSGGKPLYLVSLMTDATVYEPGPRGPVEMGLLAGEPVTGALLSPDGRYVAFVTPTDCFFCTTFIFDLQTLTGSEGPSGIASENDMAWTQDDRLVVDTGKKLAIVSPTGAAQFRQRPVGLPRTWSHALRARVQAGGIELTDSVNGDVYRVR